MASVIAPAVRLAAQAFAANTALAVGVEVSDGRTIEEALMEAERDFDASELAVGEDDALRAVVGILRETKLERAPSPSRFPRWGRDRVDAARAVIANQASTLPAADGEGRIDLSPEAALRRHFAGRDDAA